MQKSDTKKLGFKIIFIKYFHDTDPEKFAYKEN